MSSKNENVCVYNVRTYSILLYSSLQQLRAGFSSHRKASAPNKRKEADGNANVELQKRRRGGSRQLRVKERSPLPHSAKMLNGSLSFQSHSEPTSTTAPHSAVKQTREGSHSFYHFQAHSEDFFPTIQDSINSTNSHTT